MKYCSHCGKQVLDDALICPGCGCSVQPEGLYKGGAYPQYRADTYSPLSIAGFVLSFFSALIGLILSIVAHNEAKRIGSEKSQSISKAGIIISAVGVGISAFFVMLFVIFICLGMLAFI